MADTFMSRFKRVERIAERALLVRRLERIQTAMHRPDCEIYEESGDASDGYTPGNPRCDWDDPDACFACRLREADHRHIRPRLKIARRRLRYALDRIIGARDGK